MGNLVLRWSLATAKLQYVDSGGNAPSGGNAAAGLKHCEDILRKLAEDHAADHELEGSDESLPVLNAGTLETQHGAHQSMYHGPNVQHQQDDLCGHQADLFGLKFVQVGNAPAVLHFRLAWIIFSKNYMIFSTGCGLDLVVNKLECVVMVSPVTMLNAQSSQLFQRADRVLKNMHYVNILFWSSGGSPPGIRWDRKG